jgi:hypothetical protein
MPLHEEGFHPQIVNLNILSGIGIGILANKKPKGKLLSLR